MTYLRASLTIAAILATASAGLADTLYVPDDHDTIQEAIIASSHGDSIIVRPGTYVENIDFLGKAITVKSERGPDATVIDGGNPADPEYASVVIFQNDEGPNSVLDGFTLTNGTGTFCNCIPGAWSWCGGGILCFHSSPTIMNNIVSGNSESYGGIGCVYSAATITNNTITGNSTGGMFNSISSIPTVTYCTFTGNSASSWGGGMINYDYSYPTVANCTFSGNVAGISGGGIYNNRSGPIVTDCIFWGNIPDEFRDYISSPTVTCSCVEGGYPGDGNIDEDPLFCDPESGDYTLAENSPCAPFSPPNPECDLIGAWPVGCSATSVEGEEVVGPARLRLASAVPNPFNPSTRITYAIPAGSASPVLLSIYDTLGRPVRTLVDEGRSPGIYTVTWDGTDTGGARVASGVYFCRLDWGGRTQTRKLVLVK